MFRIYQRNYYYNEKMGILKLLFIGVLTSFITVRQVRAQDYAKQIAKFQYDLNAEFSNPGESPLTKKGRKKFKGLDFFPVDTAFRVEARFIRTLNAIPFRMETTTDRRPVYEKYGEAVFDLKGRTFSLSIYQSHDLRETEKYKDYLFLPFTDLTNGDETYGGGRFIDLKIPYGNTIIIDFNKAYNPSCAYNHAYSCPIPPKENDMNIRITAGVKRYRHK